MIPHESVAASGMDPASYGFRALFKGNNPKAQTLIAWIEGPTFSADCLEAIDLMIARGGSVLVMARERHDLQCAVILLAVLFSH